MKKASLPTPFYIIFHYVLLSFIFNLRSLFPSIRAHCGTSGSNLPSHNIQRGSYNKQGALIEMMIQDLRL